MCVRLISPPLLSLRSPVFGFLACSSLLRRLAPIPQLCCRSWGPPRCQSRRSACRDGIDDDGNREKQGTFGRRANIAGRAAGSISDQRWFLPRARGVGEGEAKATRLLFFATWKQTSMALAWQIVAQQGIFQGRSGTIRPIMARRPRWRGGLMSWEPGPGSRRSGRTWTIGLRSEVKTGLVPLTLVAKQNPAGPSWAWFFFGSVAAGTSSM